MSNHPALHSLMLGSTAPSFPIEAASEQRFATTQQTLSLGAGQSLSVGSAAFRPQRPFPEEQVLEFEYFPIRDRVVVREDGMFVPSNKFGQALDLRSQIQSGPHGREVVVFSQLSGAQQGGGSSPEGNEGLEQRWLLEHRSSHAGKWVALWGDRVLASGPNASEVYRTARSLGVVVPFVAYVEADEQLPFAGW